MGMTMRFSNFLLAAALATAGTFGMGCDATRRDWGSCFEHKCAPGFMCTADNKCLPEFDGGARDARQVDAPQTLADAPAQLMLDGSPIDLISPIDVGDDVPVSIGPADGAVVLDSATEAGQAGLVDAGAVDVGVVDAYIPDAAGTCAGDDDCSGKEAPYCAQGRCVSCKSGDQCSGGAPICSASHTCVSCAAVDAGCPAATPACEAASGRCLECLGDGDCSKDASKSFCQAGTCAGCAGAAASACAG